jgi:hypothetical protein
MVLRSDDGIRRWDETEKAREEMVLKFSFRYGRARQLPGARLGLLPEGFSHECFFPVKLQESRPRLKFDSSHPPLSMPTRRAMNFFWPCFSSHTQPGPIGLMH